VQSTGDKLKRQQASAKHWRQEEAITRQCEALVPEDEITSQCEALASRIRDNKPVSH